MKSLNVLVSVLAFSLLGSSQPIQSSKGGPVKGRFIIEFDPSLESGLHKRILDSTIDSELHYLWDHEHFNGMSLSSEDLGEVSLEELRQKPGVKNVWRSSVIKKRETLEHTPDSIWNSLQLTGVDRLHKRNIIGEGVVIGMIDTGVNSKHEALKGRILSLTNVCLKKKVKGADVDDGGHGTFCASVAVGNSSDFLGVAPGAKLRMYGLLDCEDSTLEQIIQGMILAYNDKVDLMSLSVGIDTPFLQDPVSLVASRMAEGIPMVFAASNSGNEGLYSGMAGAAGVNCISVGAFDTNEMIAWTATIESSDGASLQFKYLTPDGLVFPLNATFPVKYLDNLCTNQTASYNGTGEFLVGQLPNCTYGSPLEYAALANFSGIVLENVEDLWYPDYLMDYSPRFRIATSADLLAWIAQQGKDKSFKLVFNTNQRYTVLEKLGRPNYLMSPFSSWGPTFEQGFYPDISAPGGFVMGAFNKQVHSYNISSGTSFAAPYMAGVVALYLSGHKNATSKQVRNALLASAKLAKDAVIKYDDSFGSFTLLNNTYAPLLQQGSGLVDLEAFYDTSTLILSEPYLNLNDTQFRIADHIIEVQNIGDSRVEYEVSHQSLEVVYARNATGRISSAPPITSPLQNSVKISQNKFSLLPGEKISFDVSISPPANLDESKGPIFSGFFKILGLDGKTIKVPYVGMQFNARDWSPLYKTVEIENYEDLFSQNARNSTNLSIPVITDPVAINRMSYGASIFSIDLVDKDYDILTYQYPPVAGQNGYLGPLNAPLNSVDFPAQFISPVRGLLTVRFDAFGNGSAIPNGTYKLMRRALRIFGDANNSLDWTIDLSSEFILSSNTTSTLTSSKGLAGALSISTALITLQIALLALF